MTITKSKVSGDLIVRIHVESTRGGSLRVVRLEPSKAGTRLLTSKSSSISTDDQKPKGTTTSIRWTAKTS